MHALYVLLSSIILLLGNTRADCPHVRPGLLKWSSSETWGSEGEPTEGENIFISQNILLDKSPASLYNITILAGGSLIFNPEVKMELRARNIFVQGTMEIGSEDCPYNGTLTITLTGNRQDHLNEENAKVILVEAGGTLEIHGEPRLSWTKLNKTLLPPKQTNDVYFDYELTEEYNNYTGTPGLVAYTLEVTGTEVTVVKFGIYNLRIDFENLADQINSVLDGQVLMMAGQEKIIRKEGDKQNPAAYEAIETLVNGNVTGTGILRSVLPDGDTWAFIYKKGTPDSYRELTQPFGTTSSVQYIESDNLIFTAESIGAAMTNRQTVSFRVSNINAVNPLIHLIDDATTWRPADKIVIASTDYDWAQAEVREVIFCPTCNNYQIRINKPVDFMHYGKVLHNALDMRAEVALLSRKVVIRGEMEPECPAFNENCDHKEIFGDTFGANTMFVKDFKDVHIENIEIYNAGQQTDLGRYPFHFHMCFGREPGASAPYIKGCSIHDTFARCVTIHGTHGVLVMDNTCYNHMGHGYYLEDGGEQNNTLDGNLALHTMRGTGKLEPSDADLPAGFWITNPLNSIRNNNAAGGKGFGLWFIFPQEPFPPSREYNLMGPFEARRTPLREFTNNVAHSNDFFGMKIGGRLLEGRIVNCCNMWKPRSDPKDNASEIIVSHFSHLTGYKNSKFNIWLEGALLNCTKLSMSDSLNGVINSNERLLRLAGWVSHSVVIGDSENVGLPAEGFDRSLPKIGIKESPHSGITMWRGPVQYSDIWFDGFKSNHKYDMGAIAKKRGDRYYFSITNSYRDILFGFDDAEGEGNYAISGTPSDPGWKNSVDGEQVAGFTWYRDTPTEKEKWYVVKPDPLSSAGADCRLRPHWRLALCKTKYGNFRVNGNFFPTGARGVYVRDAYPGAQLEFVLEKSGGPQVPMDGSQTYTFHTVGLVPKWMDFVAEGIEVGDLLRFGVCIPPGAKWELKSPFPFKELKKPENFIQVDSLDELDRKDPEKDGKKFFFDNSTGMLYFKFIGNTTRATDENKICGGGKCPHLEISLSGNLNGTGDCRKKLYGSRLTDLPPALPLFTETFKANGGSSPPEGFGAGVQRPFKSRKPVNGKYGPWTEWSECSTTCGSGVQYKTRECNNPLPQHGGKQCTFARMRSSRCNLGSCG